MKQLHDPRFLLALLAILVLGGVVMVLHVQQRSQDSDDKALLQTLWQDYKKQSWDSKTGRTIDHQDDDVTTSEGQGYTMLRAAWEDDQSTFATTWNWTAGHLQRSDKLFSWRWGTKLNGSEGVLTNQGGQNTASDADTDIALALIMAGTRWHDTEYINQARSIAQSVWSEEVVEAAGQPYLTASNLEKDNPREVTVNPSYFAPYAYRIFGRLDPSHDWNGLAASSYAFVQKVSRASLDTGSSDGLPPDWVTVDRTSGAVHATGDTAKTTNFGFDAFRTVWRTALDWQWNHAPAAKSTLEQFGFLFDQWSTEHKLLAIYGHDGQPKASYSSAALYGGTLGYFQFLHPAAAKDIVSRQFTPLSGSKLERLNYYDNNWVWFGLGLYTQQLPDLAGEGVPL